MSDRFDARASLEGALEKALVIQQPLVARHVERMKASRPGCNPAEIVRALEKQFMATLSGSGAAVGGAALAPGVGTGVSLALSAGETVTSLNATVLYMLAVAEVHGVPVHEVERRRTLMLAILLGDSGTKFVQKATEKTGAHWANQIITKIPMSQINQINKVLGPHFITKYGTRQGVLVLGRVLPLGIGVVIGAGGNLVVARSIVAATRKAFGEPPSEFVTATSAPDGHAPELVVEAADS